MFPTASGNVVKFDGVFVPFLGDFLSIIGELHGKLDFLIKFSSPFLGTFFQFWNSTLIEEVD